MTFDRETTLHLLSATLEAVCADADAPPQELQALDDAAGMAWIRHINERAALSYALEEQRPDVSPALCHAAAHGDTVAQDQLRAILDAHGATHAPPVATMSPERLAALEEAVLASTPAEDAKGLDDVKMVFALARAGFQTVEAARQRDAALGALNRVLKQQSEAAPAAPPAAEEGAATLD